MPAPIMTARDDWVTRRKMPTGVVRMVGSRTERMSASWARRRRTLAGARKRTSVDYPTGLAAGPGAGVRWGHERERDRRAAAAHGGRLRQRRRGGPDRARRRADARGRPAGAERGAHL